MSVRSEGKIRKLKVGVLGATGAIGQQAINFLVNHPWFEIKLLTASPKSAGRKYSEVTTWLVDFRIMKNTDRWEISDEVKDMIVEETTVENIKRAKLDLIFCCLPSEVAKELLPQLAGEVMIIDKSSAFRLEPIGVLDGGR